EARDVVHATLTIPGEVPQAATTIGGGHVAEVKPIPRGLSRYPAQRPTRTRSHIVGFNWRQRMNNSEHGQSMATMVHEAVDQPQTFRRQANPLTSIQVD